MATVYIRDVTDSIVIAAAKTDKNGDFVTKTKKYCKAFFVHINYLGYQSYNKEEKCLLKNKDLGKLYLFENISLLKNVVVTSEIAPITIKIDTLEFNASSFKVRKNANVETLFKQLPGFELASDGKITVNGREVNQIFVNGKTFFDKNGSIALKNLPAEIINKVQVSDFKTKKEELSKEISTSDYSSINLTIDQNKNNGISGKILAVMVFSHRSKSNVI